MRVSKEGFLEGVASGPGVWGACEAEEGQPGPKPGTRERRLQAEPPSEEGEDMRPIPMCPRPSCRGPAGRRCW